MKNYNLTMDEVQLIVLGSLYNGLVTNGNFVVTTLDVKNYLRDIRKVNITQSAVSVALNEFYKWWKFEGFVLEVGDTAYDFERKSNGIYYTYYLKEIVVDGVVVNDDPPTLLDANLIRQTVANNPLKTSSEVRDILLSLNVDKTKVPSVSSIAAFKANINRKY